MIPQVDVSSVGVGGGFLQNDQSVVCLMVLKARHILRKLHPILLRSAPFCLNGWKNRI